jgi:hypothetical protein
MVDGALSNVDVSCFPSMFDSQKRRQLHVVADGCYMKIYPFKQISECDPDTGWRPKHNKHKTSHYVDPTTMASTTSRYGKYWLIVTNFFIALAWFRVLWTIVTNFSTITSKTVNEYSRDVSVDVDPVCRETLGSATNWALWISMMEVLNCIVGLTSSPLPAVFLFSCTRMGVEKLVAPLLPCSCWQHWITVLSWSLGDTIRFGTFAVNTANPRLVWTKSLRFMVGPILFPIGAFGEMMMVVAAAQNGRPKAYLAAVLWPVFFYPMMKQLLKQRRRHFQSLLQGEKKAKQIKSV